ncbi:hypothetical protein DMUE_5695 [Dictyocoela muelleri]|nr:hypothetical protein DMUE_5695 [Dictyocoela muelleri]
MLTIDLNYYLIHILSPIMSIWNQQWTDINRLDRMFLRSPHDLRRIVYSIWCSLRTLKQNEQISALFHQTFLWRTQDKLYRQASRSIIPKKKKKKSTDAYLSLKTIKILHINIKTKAIKLYKEII